MTSRSDRARIGTTAAILVAGAAILVAIANHLATAGGVVLPRVVIAIALFVITCGPIALWPRRDNIFAYRQAGIYFATLFIPLVGTAALTASEPNILDLYARVLAIGAAFFAAGLALGAHFAHRTRTLFSFTFAQSLRSDGPAWSVVRRRTRLFAAVAAGGLVVAFGLFRYVPLLAADRQLAKYGVGLYAPGFARGRLVYHVALALGAAVFPLTIVLAYRSRAFLDVVLCGAVGLGLMASLSRNDAFTGPLLVVIAFATGRRVSPVLILAGVCFVFFAGAVSNELLFPSVDAGPNLSERLAASAPDVRDQLAFLRGFVREGSRESKGKTLVAKLSPGASEWNPVDYAIRLTTGIRDTSSIASGGIRLPAPLWGFSSFGFPGAAMFSLVSGAFMGWGTVRIRQAVTAFRSHPDYSTNLLLGAVFFEGTYSFLGQFFFAPFSDVIVLGAAMAIGVMPVIKIARRTGAPAVTASP